MVVDHIGYAVKDIVIAKEEFEKLGFEFGKAVEDTDRNILIQFGDNGNYRIELIQTLNQEEPSPVKEILRKNGPTPYHLCYKTKGIDQDIKRLKGDKWMVIAEPKRAVAFGEDSRVAFLLKRSVGMIELVEEKIDTV